jgi:hypothetical protein
METVTHYDMHLRTSKGSNRKMAIEKIKVNCKAEK